MRRARATGQTPTEVGERVALGNLAKMQRITESQSGRPVLGKVRRAVQDPARALQYAGATYYRGRRPLRRLAARWAWSEAVRVFQEDAPEWTGPSQKPQRADTEPAPCA